MKIELKLYPTYSKIINSYLISTKNDYKELIDTLITCRKNLNYVISRSNKSYEYEVRAHNRLYKLGLFKSHTKDTDLEENIKWYLDLLFRIIGR